MNITKKITTAAFLLALIFLPGSAYAQSFDRDLYYGLQGDSSVTELQEFLTDQALYAGPITGNFFSLTLKAVKQFQVREGINPTSGYFGPSTRAKANALLSSQVQPSEQQAISETGSPPPTPTAPKTTNDVFNSLQQQVALLLQQVGLLQQQLQTQQQTQQTVQQQQNTLQQIQQNMQQAQQSNPNAESLLILENKINPKLSSRKYYSDIWREVTPYQQENCRKDWWDFKRDLILTVHRSADINTPEGLAIAKEAGLFNQHSIPADQNDSRYTECLQPDAAQYKTREQRQAYYALGQLKIEEEVNNTLIPQYKLICEGLLNGAVKWITSDKISCSY